MSVIRSLRFLVGLLAAALVLVSATPAVTTAATPARFVLNVPVLYYHHIQCPLPDTTFPDLYTCPEQFEAQMTYLLEQGWHTLTVDQVADLLANRVCPDPNAVVVSFDDGAVDQYFNAAPILESLGMRGSFFVTTGKEGGLRPGKITWDGLRDLVARGHSIGNHSKTHANEKKLDAVGLYDQIEVSQQMFAAQLGFRPRTFAYPYGRYTDGAVSQVAASGFELAFTVHAGAREASDLPFLSKRIFVEPTWTGADVLAAVQPYANGCRPATPDLAAALSNAGPWKGEDVHAAVPFKSQTIKKTGVKVGLTYNFYVRVENEAQTAGKFKIAVSTTNTAGMAIRYLVNGVDVTSSVVAGTYRTPQLAPWSTLLMKVSITPQPTAPPGSSTTVMVRAASAADPARVDVVRLIAAF